jgi:hypothetical protein
LLAPIELVGVAMTLAPFTTVPVDELVIGFAMTLPPVKSVCAATIVAQTVCSVKPVGVSRTVAPATVAHVASWLQQLLLPL